MYHEENGLPAEGGILVMDEVIEAEIVLDEPNRRRVRSFSYIFLPIIVCLLLFVG